MLKDSSSHLQSDLTTVIYHFTKLVHLLWCSQSPCKALVITVTVDEKAKTREIAQPAQGPHQMGIDLVFRISGLF